MRKVPLRYLPHRLSHADTRKQIRALQHSRRVYQQGQYYTRPKLASFTSHPSKHVQKARSIYRLSTISPSPALAKATGCSISALRKIVRKGEGAYFSSGSRPNQTAQSWGIARLASALTAGKSAAVDFNILQHGCSTHSTALKLARSARKKYGTGRGHTKRRTIKQSSFS